MLQERSFLFHWLDCFLFFPFSHYEREVEGTLLDVRRSKGEQDDTKEK